MKMRSSQRWLLRLLSIERQPSLYRLSIAGLFCAIALISGCTTSPIDEPSTDTAQTAPTVIATAYVRPTRVPPETLTQALSDVTSLHEAAELMAVLLDADPEDIRARLITESCALCDTKSGAQYGSLAGVSVAEAEAEIADGGTVWLFKGASACEFRLMTGDLSLQRCL